MTYLGTRPPTVDEWDKYELHHRARLATKPGLTGMWQVSGRSNITDFCLFLDIYEQKDVLLFLQDITCISYWIKGRGAWYVAWLIPVYAVYPLYGCIAHNRNWLSAVLAIVEIIMMALIGIPIRFQSIAAATLAFLIGDFLAKFIKANSVWAIRGAASLILISPVYFFYSLS